MFRLTPVVRNLLTINVLIFVVGTLGILPNQEFFRRFALHYFSSEHYLHIQFITYMFLHGSVGHIFSNMLGLAFFGPRLEFFWGSQRFLYFYFITGIGAGLFYSFMRYLEIHPMEELAVQFLNQPSPELYELYVKKYFGEFYLGNVNFIEKYYENPDSGIYIIEAKNFVRDSFFAVANSPTVGASGAVFGILMAFAMLFPNTEVYLMFIPIAIKAKYLVGFYGLYELFMGVHKTKGDNVAHFAHIGGMIFAFLIVNWWKKDRKNFW